MDLLRIKRNMDGLWTRSYETICCFHDIVKSIPQELSDVIPAVHSLISCDTTSKISARYSAIKTVTKDYCHLHTKFGKSGMDDRLNNNAEEYLVQS